MCLPGYLVCNGSPCRSAAFLEVISAVSLAPMIMVWLIWKREVYDLFRGSLYNQRRNGGYVLDHKPEPVAPFLSGYNSVQLELMLYYCMSQVVHSEVIRNRVL